jgi:serine/threonine-protein kinase RsbT
MRITRNERRDVVTSQDVVSVRQVVRAFAAELGFRVLDLTKVVTAASEIARNTLEHGRGGVALVEVVEDDGRRGLRLTFEDHGPGIADVALALTGGHSTTRGLGLGLSGTKRLVNEFELETRPGVGTRVRLVVWR